MSDPMQGAFGQYKPTVEQSEAHAALRDRIATLERQLAEVTAERDAVLDLIGMHKRHIELSPGIGTACQRYGKAVCEDIAAAIRARTQP